MDNNWKTPFGNLTKVDTKSIFNLRKILTKVEKIFVKIKNETFGKEVSHD